MDAASIRIRRLKPDDTDLHEVVAGLNSEEWEDFDQPFSTGSLRGFLDDDNRIYVVAYLGTDLAGACHAYVYPHPAGPLYMYIDEVDTVSRFRRKGVATAMMLELLSLSRSYGVKEAWLGTEEDNVAAVALYESLRPSEVERPGVMFMYRPT